MSFIEDGKCKLLGRPKFCQQCCADQKFRASIGVESCPHGVCGMGLGDLVAMAATPIARALKLGCVDPKTRQLREDSGCAKRKKRLNAAFPRLI